MWCVIFDRQSHYNLSEIQQQNSAANAGLVSCVELLLASQHLLKCGGRRKLMCCLILDWQRPIRRRSHWSALHMSWNPTAFGYTSTASNVQPPAGCQSSSTMIITLQLARYDLLGVIVRQRTAACCCHSPLVADDDGALPPRSSDAQPALLPRPAASPTDGLLCVVGLAGCIAASRAAGADWLRRADCVDGEQTDKCSLTTVYSKSDHPASDRQSRKTSSTASTFEVCFPGWISRLTATTCWPSDKHLHETYCHAITEAGGSPLLGCFKPNRTQLPKGRQRQHALERICRQLHNFGGRRDSNSWRRKVAFWWRRYREIREILCSGLRSNRYPRELRLAAEERPRQRSIDR